ncbi:MAG: TIGR02300 family protein [Alphaproteobacteria bacterium]|nr:TIGR02300 family protein [Alphaproteobacteria bacterium]
MTKPEWGEKRLCQACGTRYYDLRRKPLACPKCGAEFVAQSTRRRAETKSKPVEPKKPRPAPAEELLVAEAAFADEEELAVLAEGEAEEEEEEELIEDATDLGKDDEDVAEVLEGGKTGAQPEDV